MLRLWARRYRDLGSARTQLVCRLHAVLCELLPGGVATELTAGQAAQLLASITTSGAVAVARRELATQFTAGLRGIDAQMRDTRAKLTVAVRAAGTSLTGLFGAGPVIAATVIGDVRDVSRFPGRDHFAAWNGTAPAGVSSGKRKIYRLSRRGNRGSTTPSTWPRSPRSATGTARAAPTTTRKGPKARPAKKPCAR